MTSHLGTCGGSRSAAAPGSPGRSNRYVHRASQNPWTGAFFSSAPVPRGRSAPRQPAAGGFEAHPPMTRERRPASLATQAPAKVNLFLEVLGKRPDGYHDLEPLMVAVDVTDTLEFWPDESGALTLTCDAPGLTTGPDNLVLRAAESLKRQVNHRGGAAIHLAKRIPIQAGLAGGSSDAATTLKALNRLWNLGLTDTELARVGAEIGSDVAFFFASGAAWCTGRGEKVEPITLGRPLDFVL